MTIEKLINMRTQTGKQIEYIRHLKNAINADPKVHDALTKLYAEKSGEPTEIVYVIDRIADVVHEHDAMLHDIIRTTKITWPPKCVQTDDE